MHKIADAGYITLHRGSINILGHFVPFFCHCDYLNTIFLRSSPVKLENASFMQKRTSVTKIPVYGYSVFIFLIP